MAEVFSKIGTLKVKNGTYKKDGVEKNRYHEVGVLLSSPHGSSMFIKLHATATSEPKIVSIFKDDGVSIQVAKAEAASKDVIPTEDDVDRATTEDMPF
ncbi:MAG: hypothetical protein Q4E47_01230 [Candidatus Saccharibacteria bacterium]|nr:hypothetical protein [Candidatus Saccharibacteria bacterium]